ncbi:hypothetical protein ACSSS7_001944 [Eimeria intestinalis]
MFEGERVFFSNNRSDPQGFEADELGGPGSLPSLKQARLFFEQYVHHGSAVLRRRLLAEVERSNRCLLELDLSDLIEYQHRVQPADLECINTPLCARDRHRAPPDFAQRLVRCLRERPLVYLPICEKACEQIAAKSAIVEGGAIGKREPQFDVQINLTDTGRKPTAIRSLLSQQQEHFVVTTGIVISSKAPMSRMQKIVLQCRFCNHKLVMHAAEWREKPQMPRFCRASELAAPGETESDLGCKNKPEPYFIVTNESTFLDVQLLKLQELPEDVPTGDMPRHLLLNTTRFLVDEATAGDRLIVSGVLTTEAATNAMTTATDRYGRQTQRPVPTAAIAPVATAASAAIASSSSDTSCFRSNGTSCFSINSNKNSRISISIINSTNSSSNNNSNRAAAATAAATAAAAAATAAAMNVSIAPALFGMMEVKRACACLLFGGTAKIVNDTTRIRGREQEQQPQERQKQQEFSRAHQQQQKAAAVAVAVAVAAAAAATAAAALRATTIPKTRTSILPPAAVAAAAAAAAGI